MGSMAQRIILTAVQVRLMAVIPVHVMGKGPEVSSGILLPPNKLP